MGSNRSPEWIQVVIVIKLEMILLKLNNRELALNKLVNNFADMRNNLQEKSERPSPSTGEADLISHISARPRRSTF